MRKATTQLEKGGDLVQMIEDAEPRCDWLGRIIEGEDGLRVDAKGTWLTAKKTI
jgi:hypothetical protein